jgi:hypothetical protein
MPAAAELGRNALVVVSAVHWQRAQAVASGHTFRR